jgi:hypothetical protein
VARIEYNTIITDSDARKPPIFRKTLLSHPRTTIAQGHSGSWNVSDLTRVWNSPQFKITLCDMKAHCNAIHLVNKLRNAIWIIDLKTQLDGAVGCEIGDFERTSGSQKARFEHRSTPSQGTSPPRSIDGRLLIFGGHDLLSK